MRQAVCPPRVAIYRMEIKLDKDEGRLKKPDDKDKKRDEGHAEEVADEVVKRKREASSPRTYEYLDVTQLYHALHTVVLQSIQRTVLPLHQGHEIRMLVGLIALTGTDFSRGLPQMSGKSVFEHLPDIWMTLAMVSPPRLAMPSRKKMDTPARPIYTWC